MIDSDRAEDFEHIGCLCEHRIGRLLGRELCHLFAQFFDERLAIRLCAQRLHARPPARRADQVGNLVPDKFAHMLPLSRNNVSMHLYRDGLTRMTRNVR
ncbi:hypothetical protein [Mycolicibacterium tusciae]|uniref:hypothetical protein n=1 Tax=Mycolicibacterium tusciae TaxID=75922 RepID=UPI00024A3248|nr:hypothetical protein [Mycolicibacterium tusciae]